MYYAIAKSETGSRFVFISAADDIKLARADIERLIKTYNNFDSVPEFHEKVRMSSGLRPVDNVDELFELDSIQTDLLHKYYIPVCKYLGRSY